VSNNNINGSIPTSYANLTLVQIDLSNTQICVNSFPSNWLFLQWTYCNLQISHPCGIVVPQNCTLNDCLVNLKCYVDQCATGTDDCQNGRNCIQNYQNWTYTCAPCTVFFYMSDGEYKCSLTTNGIIVICVCSVVGFVLILGIIFLIRRRNRSGSISERAALIQNY